jgi:serine/threonine-protein kinase
MGISLEQFIQDVTHSGLLAAGDVAAFQTRLPAGRRPQDADGLARELVAAGKLTRYQAAAVAQGKAQSLVFAEYVILDKLGQGGMGVVLKARHRRMDRLVAVKMVPPATIKSPQAVERFYHEVQAAARLSHPNIVTAHDAGEHQGVHYLVMEYVEGRDLAAIVKEQGPLSVRQAVDYTLQAARGLQYAHEQGVIHRDIKPGNLLLDKKGVVKILDMGLARIDEAVREDVAGERLTETGQIMGTGEYMAPEQALDTRLADARSDIYALGCSLYRLLTGEPPYQGETFTQLFVAHREASLPSLNAARPDVPPALDAVFQRMIAKNPQRRQPTMRDVIAELETVQAGPGDSDPSGEVSINGKQAASREHSADLPTCPNRALRAAHTIDHGGPPEHVPNIAPPGPRPARTRRRMWIGLGLGATAVVVGGMLFAARHGMAPSRACPRTASVTPGVRPAPGEASLFVDAVGNWHLPSGAPGPASAPFDAQQARQHQEAWAKYLGVPIEVTNSIGMKLVLIPPGEFTMGSTPQEQAWAMGVGAKHHQLENYRGRVPAEGPPHRVKIGRPYYLGACPVTQREYEQLTGSNPSAFTEQQSAASGFQPPLSDRELQGREAARVKAVGCDTGRHPVETVSWSDAILFCRRLSAVLAEQAAHRVYRLPTEAEWEHACRAGTTTRFWCGDDEARLERCAWFGKDARGLTYPVGEKLASPWGLYDMHGHVWQWCADWYNPAYYEQSPQVDPVGPRQGSARVMRGGGANLVASLRSASRNSGPPDFRHAGLGFRVVCEIESRAVAQSAPPTSDESRQ